MIYAVTLVRPIIFLWGTCPAKIIYWGHTPNQDLLFSILTYNPPTPLMAKVMKDLE